MAQQDKKYKIILSGGGTGGHIFPAVSIADEMRRRHPDAEILFVGANGRMEMTRVPEAGYPIKGLPIAGIQRSLSLSNLLVPFKVLESLWQASRIVRSFHPDVVVGTGGYASAPVLFAASLLGVPTLIQEQNGFAGVTNKILSRRAKKICVAYSGLEKVFPKDKIVFTGNPIRSAILKPLPDKKTALESFGLNGEKKTVLILGGSQGAREVNKAIFAIVKQIVDSGAQVLWQCGKYYYEQYRASLDTMIKENPEKGYDKKISLNAFIKDMNCAYSASDVIISRSGASTVSELCVVGRASVLIPSPNVAEDHQRHNALALSEKNAAILILEGEELIPRLQKTVLELLQDDEKRGVLAENIKKLAKPNATADIASEVEKLLK
ncbi:MAG: undecaprenyldiphospho-muramoylpentapeptide beta-N-acetylglucosaminyltransferase [Flavobacteriales bacterium]|nr:undecaprenyldiphospho-muramoylpentapeptide beta-N-acetylglucosaminyltransferase [Flavobacteriales bacterium]